MDNILTQLNNTDWDHLIRGQDFEQNFDNLHNKITDLYESIFPKISVKNDKYKIPRKLWMTTGLMKSIEFRDSLYVKVKKTKLSDSRYNEYCRRLKVYNKTLGKCFNNAKKMYHTEQFDRYKKVVS